MAYEPLLQSLFKLLCALAVDQRCQTFANALQLADDCHRRCQAAILRSNLIRHGHTRNWSFQWQLENVSSPPF